MAVRLLAGPFHASYNGAPDVVVEFELITWWPRVGLIAYAGDLTGVMTLDGRLCDRSDAMLQYVGWWPAKKALVQYAGRYLQYTGWEYLVDPLLFTLRHVNSNERADPDANNVLALARYAKLPDRNIWYYPSGNVVVLPEGGYAYEHSFRVAIDTVEVGLEGPPSLGVSGGHITPGRSETEVFVSESSHEGNARGRFYDTVTKEWSSPIYQIGMPCWGGLVYCTDFGVMVSCHNYASNPDEIVDRTKSSVLRVWSLEVCPTSLTPVEVATGDVKSGQVVTYRVQAVGDQDDPAEGELIDWIVTGAGMLLTPQSKTDGEGYALAQVQYGVRETGASTVEARLLC